MRFVAHSPEVPLLKRHSGSYSGEIGFVLGQQYIIAPNNYKTIIATFLSVSNIFKPIFNKCNPERPLCRRQIRVRRLRQRVALLPSTATIRSSTDHTQSNRVSSSIQSHPSSTFTTAIRPTTTTEHTATITAHHCAIHTLEHE